MLKLRLDARSRFERGLAPTSPFWGTEVATRLILEICGGEASELVVHGAEPAWRREIGLRHSRIAGLVGVAVPEPRAKQILTDLGFEVAGAGEAITAVVPSWRVHDAEGEADLVEEVVRINDSDNIPVVPMPRDHVVRRPAPTASCACTHNINTPRHIAHPSLHMCATTRAPATSRAAPCLC